ncbi:MAG: hypothetical protein C0475_01425 [Planctomyces sp.]|nr:hypothetical protein [Planctomyces sp.]MBA4119244.1 hypothetical protein [Isosphaera sp.]
MGRPRLSPRIAGAGPGRRAAGAGARRCLVIDANRTLRALGRATIGAACALGGLAGCAADPRQDYSFRPTYRTDVQSIAVPVFRNDSFEFGLESRLTAAVLQELRRTTPWKVVGQDAAQTVLTGTITRVELQRLSLTQTTGLSEELAVRVTVNFGWVDRRTGQVLEQRRDFTGVGTFIPARGVSERIESGQNEAIAVLARDIVAELRGDW